MTGSIWRNLFGLVLAGLLASASAGPAFAAGANMVKATNGYLYFNRPGADMATHDSELRNCLETWQGGVQPQKPTQPIVGGQGIVGDAIGTAVAGAMMQGWEKARFAVNVEHCMIVRGWRLVWVPDVEGRALAALDRQTLASTLAPWVGAETPHGVIVRIWRNEAALSDSIMGRSPQGSSHTLLSSLAMNADAPEPARQVRTLPDSWLLPINGVDPLPPGTTPSVPEGSALLILRLTGTPALKWSALGFEQAGEPAPGSAHRATIFASLRKAPMTNGQAAITLAYVVPAGTWRMYHKGSAFDFCMGAPSFEAKPGDVVYLGSFDFGPAPLKPDLTLAPAVAFLEAGSPLASRVRPAQWVNGSTSLCRNWHPYAIEFEGFPYEPGYAWGGAARR